MMTPDAFNELQMKRSFRLFGANHQCMTTIHSRLISQGYRLHYYRQTKTLSKQLILKLHLKAVNRLNSGKVIKFCKEITPVQAGMEANFAY
ncbi:MAG: hypothetical protein CMJ82_15780 [Planctomycetaceae bacterium]|nr:hypothetical protein [Planctomycetaceae bacterium]